MPTHGPGRLSGYQILGTGSVLSSYGLAASILGLTMQLLESIPRQWHDEICVVAGSGPSLTLQQGELCRKAGIRGIAVNDAHRMLPWADVLYACDAKWWSEYDGVLKFSGKRISSYNSGVIGEGDVKAQCATRWGLTLVHGAMVVDRFSLDPRRIHYGENSGFQAVNLALLFGCKVILLLGFDMNKAGKRHFFGNHPPTLRNADPSVFRKNFNMAATDLRTKRVPVQILNCSPDSALEAFPKLDLALALQQHASIKSNT